MTPPGQRTTQASEQCATRTPSTIESAPSPTLTTPPTTHRFSSVVTLDHSAYSSPKALIAANDVLLVHPDSAEGVWQSKWLALLSLPEYIAHGGVVPGLRDRECGLVRELNLGEVCVSNKPNLLNLELHRLLAQAITDSSSSATSSRPHRSPHQLQSDFNPRGARIPDLAWVAKGRSPTDSAMSRPVAASGIGEIKSELEKAKAGFVQGLLYVALNHALSGAQFGFSAFRDSFARFFVLSDNVIATDRLLPLSDASTHDYTVEGPDTLLDMLQEMTNAEFVQSLPFSLRSAADDVDETALQAIAKWSIAAYRKILRLPQQGPFLPFSASRSVSAMALQAQLHLDAEARCVRALGVVGSKIARASSRSGSASTGTAASTNFSSDFLAAPGGVGGKRSRFRHASPSAKQPRTAAGNPVATKGAGGAAQDAEAGFDRGAGACTTVYAEAGEGVVDGTAGRSTTRHRSQGDSMEGEVEGGAPEHEDEVVADDEGEGDDVAPGDDEQPDDGEDVFWSGGKEVETPFSGPLPMPRARQDPDFDLSQSSDESLSERTIFSVFRRSGIRIVFLAPDKMDSLIQAPEETKMPVTDSLATLEIGPTLRP